MQLLIHPDSGNVLQIQVEGETLLDEFDQMEHLQALTGVQIPGNLKGLRQKEERHTGVIEKQTMLDYVMGL